MQVNSGKEDKEQNKYINYDTTTKWNCVKKNKQMPDHKHKRNELQITKYKQKPKQKRNMLQITIRKQMPKQKQKENELKITNRKQDMRQIPKCSKENAAFGSPPGH